MRRKLYGKMCRPFTRWLFAFAASRTARRISAISGASLAMRFAPKGASNIARPSFSITSEIAICSPHFSFTGSNDAELLFRLNDFLRDGRGDLRAIPAVFHDNSKGNSLIGSGIVRREAREPGMRQSLIKLRGSGLARDAQIQAGHRPSSRTGGHNGTHGFRQKFRGTSRKNRNRRGCAAILGIQYPATLGHESAGGNGRGNPRHLERRGNYRPLTVGGKRQHLPEFRIGANRNTEEVRSFAERLRANRKDAELREIGVAGNGNGSCHVEGPVRVIADVVANRTAPAGNNCPCPAIAESSA